MTSLIPQKPFHTIIAIDGYSSCGKSTLAKQLAQHLNYIFVDTGAMYRAVALYFIQHKVDTHDHHMIANALKKIKITFKNIDGTNTVFLNGLNVEFAIRSMQVSKYVSEVATISEVRKKLVYLQRKMGKSNDLVMDGRDIGTVVFPSAQVKFFITADPEVRAQRRYKELLDNNQPANFDEVLTNLKHRDTIDSTRPDSPLKKAEDAFIIDNTNLTKDQQFELALSIILSKLGSV